MTFKLLQWHTDSLAGRLTGRAYNWVESFAPKLVLALLVFFAGQWIIKMAIKTLKKILFSRNFDATLRPFIQNLLQTVLQLLLVLLLMQILGIRMTIIAAVVGAFGVAIGLALSGTLQNFASGILIILLKPFRVGDNIQTQGEKGTVTAIRLFYSVIKTFNNTTVIVPNSKLSNEVIFNLTREKERRLDISFKLNYSTDFKKVQYAILNTINAAEQVLKKPHPRIGVEKIDSDGYTILINVWVNAHGYEDARLSFNEAMMASLTPLFPVK